MTDNWYALIDDFERRAEKFDQVAQEAHDLVEELKRHRDAILYQDNGRGPWPSTVTQLVHCQTVRERFEKEVENLSSALKAMRLDLEEAREQRDEARRMVSSAKHEARMDIVRWMRGRTPDCLRQGDTVYGPWQDACDLLADEIEQRAFWGDVK